MANRLSLLHRLEAEGSSGSDERLKACLASEDTTLLSGEPARVTVHHANRVWRVRFQILRDQGLRLYGAEELLAGLGSLTQQKQLEQFSFRGSELAGEIFFEHASGRFVGSVMVDYVPKATRAIPVEVELFA